MSVTQQLRLQVNERLTAAAEEIFGLVEKTVTDYQEEVVRSKREIIQLRQQIEQLTVLQPRILLFKEDIESVMENQTQPPAEENKETHDHHMVKEEPRDVSILPDLEADVSLNAEITNYDSETQPPVEENNETRHQRVKEEELDVSVFPDLEIDFSKNVNLTDYESETTTQTDSQLLQSDSYLTVTLNEGFDDEWIGNAGTVSGLSSFSQNPDNASSSHPKQPQVRKPCHMCFLNFKKDCHLIKHVNKSHAGHKAFKCFECHKEFARREGLGLHLRIHKGEKPYKCPYCEKSFTQTSNFRVHMRTHTGEKPYFCDSCGEMVANTYHLKMCNKSSSSTANVERPFRCSQCGKKFKTLDNLSAHMKIHKARKAHT